MKRVVVWNEVDWSDPSRSALEKATEDAFVDLDGEWVVRIREARNGRWWLVRAEGPDFDRSLVIEPPEQNPETVRNRLLEVLPVARPYVEPPRPKAAAPQPEPVDPLAGLLPVPPSPTAKQKSGDSSLTDMFDDWLQSP